jgi:hypothetical protein
LSNKKTFILRLDPETFAILEKWAADEYRSVNGQVEYLLNMAITKASRQAPKKKAEKK